VFWEDAAAAGAPAKKEILVQRKACQPLIRDKRWSGCLALTGRHFQLSKGNLKMTKILAALIASTVFAAGAFAADAASAPAAAAASAPAKKAAHKAPAKKAAEAASAASK